MYDFLSVITQLLSVAIALISVLITVLINWKALKKSWRSNYIRQARGKIDETKRKLIQALPVLTVGVGSWLIVRFTPIYEYLKKGMYHFLPGSKALVVNAKNGVIHHKLLCSDHLPKKVSKTTPYKLAVKPRFHASYKVAMLSDLAQNVSAEDAIEILLLAAADSPTSVHLYDKMVKLLGKIKRYESIHMMLESAEINLVEKSKGLPVGSKQLKKYLKAIAHIQLQREKSKERAKYSALQI